MALHNGCFAGIGPLYNATPATGQAAAIDRSYRRAHEVARRRQLSAVTLRLSPTAISPTAIMKPQEFRAAAALAAVFSVRLLGLFMIYPVFAAYAGTLAGASPYLIGEALGIYGLSQGLLQIPFGLLSDRIGRKVMIVLGLALFGAGSAVAAISTTIGGVIIGRALQGAGAVGSVILALVADLTGEDSRTAAMAMVGITIGASFIVALLA